MADRARETRSGLRGLLGTLALQYSYYFFFAAGSTLMASASV